MWRKSIRSVCVCVCIESVYVCVSLLMDKDVAEEHMVSALIEP
jgi:hypothetical protein